MCLNCGGFLGGDGSCSRCLAREVVVEDEPQVSIDNTPIPPMFPNDVDMTEEVTMPPVVPNDIQMTEEETVCSKCCRTTTDDYPLDFQTLNKDSVHSTMFGKPIREVVGDTVTMCQQCLIYNSNDNRSTDWPNAWPSVMYTFLFETHRFNSNTRNLLNVLPVEIRLSFRYYLNIVCPGLYTSVNETGFRDITKEKSNFWTLITTRTAKTLVQALTEYCFPNVRCPAGCFEFIEKTSGISFAHFLNYLHPTFTSFNANSSKFLNGARKNFLERETLLEKFEISPCVINNQNGLQLVTCSDHENGVKLKYVHVPTNPLVGNVSIENADRLALMVSSVRTVRPLKIGSKSATFTMCRVDSGRVSGVSSTVLHKFRNFDAPYNERLFNLEKFIINCRTDVQDVIRSCCQNEEMSNILAEFYLNSDSPISNVIVEKHISNSVVFGMDCLMKMKDFVESCPDDMKNKDYFKAPIVFGHTVDDYGQQPPTLPQKIFEDFDIFAFVVAFCTQDILWSKLVPNCEDNSDVHDVCVTLHKLRQNIRKSFAYIDTAAVNALTSAFENIFGSKTDAFVNICEILDGCMVVQIQRREFDIRIDCTRNDVFVLASVGSAGRNTQIPFELTSINGHPFNLTLIVAENRASVRYGPPFFGFWTMSSDKHRPVKDPSLQEQYNRSWKYLVYVSKTTLPESTKLRYLTYMGGQGVFFCREHNYPLTTDYMTSNRKCSLPRSERRGSTCARKSAWRCPKKNCFASTCKSHFRELCDTTDRVLVDNTHSDEPIADSSDEEIQLPQPEEQNAEPEEPQMGLDNPGTSYQEEEEANMDEFDAPQLIVDAGYQDNNAFTSDSGCEPVYLSNDSNCVPMHVLLNGECQVMKRLRYPTPVGKKFQRFFQNFVSTLQGRAIPFLQVEAHMFVHIFYKELEDGSFPGALPFFLYDDRKANSKFDFDGLHEHMKLRLKDATLLTSSSLPYIMHAFDAVLNLSLVKCHTNQLFKRGLQNIQIGKYKPQQLTSTESVLRMDSVDSDVHVNRLAAACKSEIPDIFVTFTCNQKEHPGVAEVVQAIYELYGNATTEELKEVLQAYMVIIVRCWTRTIELLLDYLRFSDEHILGEILKVWGRAEFQNAAANLQHYHILFWLKNTCEDIIDKIQCAHKHVFNEFKNLFHTNFGTVDSEQHAEQMFDDCVKIQTHNCEKGHCLKKVRLNGERKCRFPPYPESHVPWYKEFHQPHSNEALEALSELGLAEPLPGTETGFQVTSTLKAGKYMYAAQKGEHMSPCNVPLWSITKSSLNVLKVCHSVAHRYLTSYTAGKEEHADVNIHPDNSHNVCNVRVQNIQNKKLGGVRKILAREAKQNKTDGLIDSTTIASTECVSWLLQLPTVLTTMDFVSCPSVPLENRGGVLLKRKNNTQSRVDRPGVANEGPAEVRQLMLSLPPHRWLTEAQKTVLESVNQTAFSTDKVTVFSLRPPELLFVDKLMLYFRWFVREKVSKKNVHLTLLKLDITESHWLDGEGYAIRLRPCAVEEFENFVLENCLENPSNDRLIDASLVISVVLNEPTHSNYSFFVSEDKTLSNTPAEVVFSKVYPRSPANFLVHVLLSTGSFETELELFDVPSLKDAFVKGKIIEDKQYYDESDVNEIVKKYVLEELRYMPGGTRSFDANFLAAKNAFKGLLINNDIYCECLPITLMTTLTEALEDKALKMMRQSQLNIIKSLVQKKLPGFPSRDDFEYISKESPSNWAGDLVPNSFQSVESLQEQSSILELLKNGINECVFVEHKFRKHQLILGPPGTGKTYVLTMALGFALSKGLFCLVTSLAARRSMQFGGEHIHKLFCLPTVNNGSPLRMAEQALSKLDYKNDKKMLLLAVEVLFVEEISLISAEQWSAMDIILQELKQVTMPFGGILVVASGDQMQLPAISGSDIFFSPVLLTNFALFFLEHFVRMTDADGQTILKHMWRRPILRQAIQEIIDILGDKCTFKETWEDLDDPCVMRVFGKRKAEQKEFEDHIQRVRASGTPYKIFHATDEICLAKSKIWTATDSVQVTNHLNKEVNEPKQLIVYPKALLRVTVNMESEQLSQGQVGVVHEVPTGDSVTLYIPDSSGGEVTITSEMLQQEQYLAWRSVTLRKQMGFVQPFKKNSVRRQQLPLMNFVALTTHKLMGDTFDKLATSISANGNNALWMTSQVFVIVSRVKQLKNLTFVGSKSETLNAVRTILETRDRREEHMFSLLDGIRNNSRSGSTAEPINISRMSFVPFNKNIPETPNGFVYLLTSVNPNSAGTFYIGQTSRALLTRLSEHNTGNGAEFTKVPHRLPWAVAAFICNFASANSRKDLEEELHRCKIARRHSLKTLEDMIALFQEKVNEKDCSLYFCVCGGTGPT